MIQTRVIARRPLGAAVLVLAGALAGCAGDGASAADPDTPEMHELTNGDEPAAPRVADEGQTHFDSPDAALAAILEICETHDADRLAATFGPSWTHLLVTSDQARDRVAREEFLAAARTRAEWIRLDDGSMELIVGIESWPMPIPLVPGDEGWWFDSAAGAEEILNRRIGEDELSTIETLAHCVRAQEEYASRDRDGDRVLEYAQRIGSTEGTHDGLYWPAPAGADDDVSPLGPMIAAASASYVEQHRKGDPWMGYHYRVLTAQGEHAPGGAHDYVINGNMVAGFAFVAYPSDYGNTGVMTFVVSRQGIVYEKDLGADTAEIAAEMTAYDPDGTWVIAEGPTAE